MIRRLYKARISRYGVILNTYKQWWTFWHTTLNDHRRLLLTHEYTITSLSSKIADRNNSLRGWTRIYYTPQLILINQYIYRQKRKQYIVKKIYQARTGWQTKTRFLNTLEKAGLAVFTSLKNFKSFTITKITQNKILYNNYNKYFLNNIGFCQKYVYLEPKRAFFWVVKGKILQFDRFGVSGYYSWRELTARMVQNGHWRYIFHMHFTTQTKRNYSIKLLTLRRKRFYRRYRR